MSDEEKDNLEAGLVSTVEEPPLLTPSEAKAARKAQLLDAIEVMTDWVIQTDDPEDEDIEKAVDVVNRMLREFSVRQRVFLAATTKRHILAIMELAEDIDRIEQSLRNINPETLTPGMRLEVHKALTRRQEALLAAVKAATDETMPMRIDDPIEQKRIEKKVEEHNLAALDVKSRDRVSKMLSKISEMRNKLNGETKR